MSTARRRRGGSSSCSRRAPTAARGAVPARTELRAALTEAGRAALGGGERLGPEQRLALERLLSAGGRASCGRGPDRGMHSRRLEARGLVELSEVEVAGARRRQRSARLRERRASIPSRRARSSGSPPRLDGQGGELLLHGVTGSGKTEVYLAATDAALERGRGAIVLVPEIALTPQTVGRFAGTLRRPGGGAPLCAQPGERRDEWQRLRRGEARICVGPRSAVFAPVAGLGLVVVDEEHDPSYKQESDPRYDARDVAARRAADAGAVLVAGSATPRPESWLRLERLDLPRRADGTALPAVEVVDMRERDGRAGPLHARTRAALAEVAERGGKAIVMVPRRGWSPHLSCHECGHTWRCPELRRVARPAPRPGRAPLPPLRPSEPAPASCPECSSVSDRAHGAGTERIEELIAALIEPLPVFRLDSDAAAGRGAHAGSCGVRRARRRAS